MKAKTYIPIFFVLIFFGKLLSVEAALPQLLFDAETIAFVNPFCKKKSSKKSSETEMFSEASATLVVHVNSFCNSVFKVDFFEWKNAPVHHYSEEIAYQFPTEISAFSSKFYPPPKL
ncbi:MAG TPA: hypothetical protein VFM70_06995 [Salinimicrobium sp.]|nr:hypothetical protein [Salinimicrobium sp.]